MAGSDQSNLVVSRRLIYILSGVGAALLVGIVTLVILLIAQGNYSAVSKPGRSVEASSSSESKKQTSSPTGTSTEDSTNNESKTQDQQDKAKVNEQDQADAQAQAQADAQAQAQAQADARANWESQMRAQGYSPQGSGLWSYRNSSGSSYNVYVFSEYDCPNGVSVEAVETSQYGNVVGSRVGTTPRLAANQSAWINWPAPEVVFQENSGSTYAWYWACR